MASDNILVIGGGPTGMEAAKGIASLGYKVILVEKRERLGGTPDASGYAALTPDMRNADEAIAEMAGAITNNPNVTLMFNTMVMDSSGSEGDFKVKVLQDGKESIIEAASVVVCTGFTHFDPGRETQKYGYYEHDDVITLVDAEKMLKAGNFVRPSNGEKPKQVCFIQCVGSRDRQIGNEFPVSKPLKFASMFPIAKCLSFI
jgi:heterodisulfide reductase subunit A